MSNPLRASTASLVFCALLPASALAADWDHTEIPYGTEVPDQQWLNLLLVDSDAPTPIYLFAHANGGTAYDLTDNSAEIITGEGYSVLSWESVESIASVEDIETGWADIELVFAWIAENAETYNLDPDQIIVGGRSRGSIISWKMAHSGRADIEGAYFYNALPDGAWAGLDVWNPVDDVTADSPPLYLAYGPAPNDGDSHNPVNLDPVLDRYEELGMGDQVTLTDDMNADGLDPFHFFPDFVASLGDSDPSDDTGDDGDEEETKDDGGCSSAPLPRGVLLPLLVSVLLVRRR